MSAPIPPVLAPCIEQYLALPSLVLLTSVLETPTNWLVVGFLGAAISGLSDDAVRSGRNERPGSNSEDEKQVIFLSVFRSFHLWVELGKKIGLDLSRLMAAGRLTYIDGLSASSTAATASTKHVHLKSLKFDDIKTSINTAVQNLTPTTQAGSNTVVILDGLDLLLALQTNPAALEIQQYLTNLQSQVGNLVLSCSADGPLLHNVDAASTPLEFEHSTFLRSLAHQSDMVMQLRPLETGHAKDVSGTIQIAQQGPRGDNAEEHLDGEWLYFVKGDGSVKVWSRGE